LSADCPPVSLTGMDDIPGLQPPLPPPPGRHRARGGAEMLSEDRLLGQGLGMAGQWLGEYL
jgi:hypothetical protein